MSIIELTCGEKDSSTSASPPLRMTGFWKRVILSEGRRRCAKSKDLLFTENSSKKLALTS